MIGVFLVVALLSLSEGIKNAILTQLKMMGENVLIVIPGEGGDIMTAMMGGFNGVGMVHGLSRQVVILKMAAGWGKSFRVGLRVLGTTVETMLKCPQQFHSQLLCLHLFRLLVKVE